MSLYVSALPSSSKTVTSAVTRSCFPNLPSTSSVFDGRTRTSFPSRSSTFGYEPPLRACSKRSVSVMVSLPGSRPWFGLIVTIIHDVDDVARSACRCVGQDCVSALDRLPLDRRRPCPIEHRLRANGAEILNGARSGDEFEDRRVSGRDVGAHALSRDLYRSARRVGDFGDRQGPAQTAPLPRLPHGVAELSDLPPCRDVDLMDGRLRLLLRGKVDDESRLLVHVGGQLDPFLRRLVEVGGRVRVDSELNGNLHPTVFEIATGLQVEDLVTTVVLHDAVE